MKKYIACDGRCLEDTDVWGMQCCYDCPGKIKFRVKHALNILTIVLFSISAALIIFGMGWIIGHSSKRTMIVTHVENTIVESIKQGKPFIFHNGRIGIVIKRQLAKNGKTIAYRAVSFTYPDDDPAVFIPIKKFPKKGMKK